MQAQVLAAALTLVVAAMTVTAAPAVAANTSLHISKVYVNSPGPDMRSTSSLNAEYVVISNASYSGSTG